MRACKVLLYCGMAEKPTLCTKSVGTRTANRERVRVSVRVRFGEISFAQGFAGLGSPFFFLQKQRYIKFNLR